MRRGLRAILLGFALLWPCAALAGGEERREMPYGAAQQPAPGQPLAVVPPREAGLTRRAVAVTPASDGTAPLYERPDGESAVLMTYYSGAPLEVIRAAGGDFVQVQAGDANAGLMGYMRAADVRIGDDAQRRVQPCFMRLEFNREAAVHAYCDEGAPVIGLCDPYHTYYAMGKNDGKWVQLYLPPQTHVWEEENRMTCGFVRLETGMARGYWQELSEWEVEPLTGEIAPEQMAELAIDMLESDARDSLTPEIYHHRRDLEKMDCRVYFRQVRGLESSPDASVYFWERAGGDAVFVRLNSVEPGSALNGGQAYIAPDGWDAYRVTPTL